MRKRLLLIILILVNIISFGVSTNFTYSAEIQDNITKKSRGFTTRLNELLDSYVKPKEVNISKNMIAGALSGKGISEKTKKLLEIKTQRSDELKAEINKAIKESYSTIFTNYKSYLNYKNRRFRDVSW